MKERHPLHSCREVVWVLLASTATISLTIGVLACSSHEDNQPLSPPMSPDASPDVVQLAGDTGSALSEPDSSADLADAFSPLQVEAGTESGGWDGSADTTTDNARDGRGIAQVPITACADVQLSDPDEILAEVPTTACTGYLSCDYGPPVTVCSQSFGESVHCSCANSLMSCEDVRQVARDQEAFELSIDGGAACPWPSWPHDAGVDQQPASGN